MNSMGEKAIISTEPIAKSNQTERDLLESAIMTEEACIRQAAELSYAVTAIAVGEEG